MKNLVLSNKNSEVTDLDYMNSATIGLLMIFQKVRDLILQDLNFEIPQITKWRFKSKVVITKESFNSEKRYFTNDVFNDPQFLLESNNFVGN